MEILKNNRIKEKNRKGEIDILTEFSTFEETLNNSAKLWNFEGNRVKNALTC